jgi:hypothetical protein
MRCGGSGNGKAMLANGDGRPHQALDRLKIRPLAMIAERQGSAFRSSSCGAADPVHVALRLVGQLVVEHVAHAVHIALYDVRIHDNDIRAMGLSGVSVAFFFDLAETPDLIGVEDLEVLRNRIEGCLRGDLSAFTDSMTLAAGYGGIALAQVGDGIFRDNEIVGNGRDSLVQVSGIFVLFAAAIVIEGNRIHDNGPRRGATTAFPSAGAAAS